MTHPFTRALYDRLPEGFPAQLVDGRLVRDPAPTGGHQALVGALYLALAPLVGLKRALLSPVDVALDETNVLQPDLAVYATPPPLDRRHAEIPAVVFEVLSPSSRHFDRRVKAGKYLAAGVREVWLVDPERETVEIRTIDGRRVFRGESGARSAILADFVVVPRDLFETLL